MTIEKIPHNGMIVITDIVGNEFVKQRYVYYTVKEAKLEFKEYLKSLKGAK